MVDVLEHRREVPAVDEPLDGEEAVSAVESRRRALRVVGHTDAVIQAHLDGQGLALACTLGSAAERWGPEKM